MTQFDVAIIGGGINGAGIARDAAGRGLRVLLVEQSDLASGTSSASTKLIHGGLRYLEHGWFRLVREALFEREVLLRMAPHLVRPARFVLPHEPGMRPAWLLRLGLFIYDHLGGRKILPATHTIDLSQHELGRPLKGRYHYGFSYSDCQVDDSRLVVLNALDAAERGAVVRTRTRCVKVERSQAWSVVLEKHGRRTFVSARVLINAAGPWAGVFNETVVQQSMPQPLRLVQGSHIVVRRLFAHEDGYIFQAADGRVVFALPFEQDFTLIGTTDRNFTGDPASVAPTSDEISYLCGIVNDHFRTAITAPDVIWSFAGVRALYGDASARPLAAKPQATRPQDTPRDYVLALDEATGMAPLLTVYGGKITTFRVLAEAALKKLGAWLGGAAPWTSNSHLPGGDFAVGSVEEFVKKTCVTWPFLDDSHARRLVRSYGTRVARILGSAKCMDDLGPRFGANLTGAEVRYLMAHEWAQTAEDVLWRRSKLGLLLSRGEQDRLGSFMVGEIGKVQPSESSGGAP
jgi:glycerol-3-phosphate dehydrogenase